MEQTFAVKQVKGKDITNSDIFWWDAANQWQCVEASMLNGVFFTQDKTYLVKLSSESPEEAKELKTKIEGKIYLLLAGLYQQDKMSIPCKTREDLKDAIVKEIMPLFTKFSSSHSLREAVKEPMSFEDFCKGVQPRFITGEHSQATLNRIAYSSYLIGFNQK